MTSLVQGVTTVPELMSLYQLMPNLSEYDYVELKNSIAECFAETGAPFWPGYEPVEDEEGRVMDGHHRLKACAELGYAPSTRVQSGWSPEYKWVFAYRVNTARRHLTIEKRREIAEEFIKLFPASTNAQVAEASGISEETARKMRLKGEAAGDLPRGVHHTSDAFPQDGESDQTQRSDEKDDERSPLQTQDHRGECWVRITYGYPGRNEDSDPRVRTDQKTGHRRPYPKETKRRTHTGPGFIPADDGRIDPVMILQSPMAVDAESIHATALEIGQLFQRWIRKCPLDV